MFDFSIFLDQETWLTFQLLKITAAACVQVYSSAANRSAHIFQSTYCEKYDAAW